MFGAPRRAQLFTKPCSLWPIKTLEHCRCWSNGKLVGIFSERDYARKVILLGKTSRKTFVREIMTPHVVYATPDMTNEQGLTLMTAKHIRHLPVVEGEEMTGMVSIGDLVRSIISEQKEMITQLEQYILHYTSIT